MVWEGGWEWRAWWTKKGWRSTVQYSERLFPVFVRTSSLISVMQRNRNEERKMKALASKRSVENKDKKKKTYGFYQAGSLSTACCISEYFWFEYKNVIAPAFLVEFFFFQRHIHTLWSPCGPGRVCAVNQDSQTCKRCKWTACQLMLMSMLNGTTETH